MTSHWPPAELCRYPPSRKYREKWSRTQWRPFMWAERGYAVFPNGPGSDHAARTPAQPGIYEFAISRTVNSRTLHTVYVGMSGNLRQRHQQYANNGSHISDFIEHALERGNILWRRILFTDTKLRAQQEEMLCHTVLDYPWNRDQNPSGRRYLYTTKRNDLLGTKVLVVTSQSTGRTVVRPV